MEPREYFLINRAFAILGGLSLAYFVLFHLLPPWLQIPSFCKGEAYCTSEGMTRALNASFKFDFAKAVAFNTKIKVFLPLYLIHLGYRFGMSVKMLKVPAWLPWFDLAFGLFSLGLVFVLFL